MDEEDADEALRLVDDLMAARRKTKKEDKSAGNEPSAGLGRGAASSSSKTASLFADLSSQLSHLTEEQWLAIPDIGDRTVKKRRYDRYTPLPSSLPSAVQEGPHLTVLAERTHSALVDYSLRTAAATTAPASDNRSLVADGRPASLPASIAQEHLLGESSVGIAAPGLLPEETPASHASYLSTLDGATERAQMGEDIERSRQLLRSLVTSNPGNVRGWLAAAQLEDRAGRPKAAAVLLESALETHPACHMSEELWLRYCHIHINWLGRDKARATLARAVAALPSSKSLWMLALSLECGVGRRRDVLRRALEHNPTDGELWRLLVDTETVADDARVVLEHAVTCAPSERQLWLALAKLLPSVEEARAVLLRARRQLPDDLLIWIAAAQLEEAHNHAVDPHSSCTAAAAACVPVVVDIVSEAANRLLDESTIDSFIRLADDSLAGGFPRTARAICVMLFQRRIASVDARNRSGDGPPSLRRPLSGAVTEKFQNILTSILRNDAPGRKPLLLASMFCEVATDACPDEVSLWQERVAVEMRRLEAGHVTNGDIVALLAKALSRHPTESQLWKQLAAWHVRMRDWKQLETALAQSAEASPMNVAWWPDIVRELTCANLLEEALSVVRAARPVLACCSQELQESDAAGQIWLLTCQLERLRVAPMERIAAGAVPDGESGCSGALSLLEPHTERLLALVREGISATHGRVPELFLLLSRWLCVLGRDMAGSRSALLDGLSSCSDHTDLSIALAQAELRSHGISRARISLEKARLRSPTNADLWFASLMLEIEAAGRFRGSVIRSSPFGHLLSRAVDACPSSGKLWSLAIQAEPERSRSSKVAEGLRACTDPQGRAHVEAAAAMHLSGRAGRQEEATTWFQRSLASDALLGDTWGLFLNHLRMLGPAGADAAALQSVQDRCISARPCRGWIWQRVAQQYDVDFVGAPPSIVSRILEDVCALTKQPPL